MAQRRYVWIEDQRGTRLPFSKGILATSLTGTGATPEDAYRVAESIEDLLFAQNRETVPVSDLIKLADQVIDQQLGREAAGAWAAWVEVRRTGYPIVVLIGGATGVGKSTVATRLAGRLGITQVVATDAIREVMRGMFPTDILPTLHVSSFEAQEELQAPLPAEHDPVVAGFRQQTELVAVGIRKLVERAVVERNDLILEGVHLVPGMLAKDVSRWRESAAVCRVTLAVTDARDHQAHFLTRLEHTQSRRPERYITHFQDIRAIHRYLVRQADAHGIPIIHVGPLDQAIQSVLEQVVSSVVEVAEAEA